MDTKLPTERQILKCILDLYESNYPGEAPKENDPYMPIDVKEVATRLKCKPELLFGYLYYYLDHKYRYQNDSGVWTNLFSIKVGEKRHCVNYPYLAGILASNEVEHRRNLWSLRLSGAAVTLSLISIITQIFTN